MAPGRGAASTSHVRSIRACAATKSAPIASEEPPVTIHGVTTRQRPIDRGRQRAAEIRRNLGTEIRRARVARGLSCREVGEAVGLSAAEVSRIERGLIGGVTVVALASLLSAVGLELAARAYPAGDAIRDAAHVRLLARFRSRLHADLSMPLEVPLPDPRDLRAWDAAIVPRDRSWRYGVEAETHPSDGQDLARRLMRKQRDGGMDGVILVLPDTRTTRALLRDYAPLLTDQFPVPGEVALRRLTAGMNPGGNAVAVL